MAVRPQGGPLRELARLYDVQTAYYDVDKRRQQAGSESLLAVLKALGAPLNTFDDVPAALRERRLEVWRAPVEPVVVAWDGGPVDLDLRLPADRADGRLACRLEPEEGEPSEWTVELAGPNGTAVEVEGARFVAKTLPLPARLPAGYHRLVLETNGLRAETMVVSSPVKAHRLPEGERRWGVFAPMYALHSGRSWGGGDFSELEALMDWVEALGGGMVATLPLLAAFLDEPFEPSPYAPVSRLFWNEFFIDVDRVPELSRCPAARAIVASRDFVRDVETLRTARLVDYRRQMAMKRSVLEELARCFFAEESERQIEFRRFVAERPQLEDYARFRAACERRRAAWPAWPQDMRDGSLRDGNYNDAAAGYHLYVQWLADSRLAEIAERKDNGAGLYLDLPLGVHPDGYDVWRERQAFAEGVSGGAPPDAFFSRGQDWGFRPIHPKGLREQGYRYWIAALRHHLRHCGMLRIDHVMGLHRLFWVPQGMRATEGVYVRYPVDELYAILVLESRRHGVSIVGEDLGTVPPFVRSSMARHSIYRSYVIPFEMKAEPDRALAPPRPDSVAALNTHDLPTFAAFWSDEDLEEVVSLGLLDAATAEEERKSRREMKEALVTFLRGKGLLNGRSAEAGAVFRACLAYLAGGRSPLLLVNMEDLWLEEKRQNVPGTWDQHPNWRRKLRYSMEQITASAEIRSTLREVDTLRKGKRGRQ